jgi:hypothetical protein
MIQMGGLIAFLLSGHTLTSITSSFNPEGYSIPITIDEENRHAKLNFKLPAHNPGYLEAEIHLGFSLYSRDHKISSNTTHLHLPPGGDGIAELILRFPLEDYQRIQVEGGEIKINLEIGTLWKLVSFSLHISGLEV